MITKHWHTAIGLPGYGPDAADTDGFTAVDIDGLAALVVEELSRVLDSEAETLSCLADEIRTQRGDRGAVSVDDLLRYFDTSESIDALSTLQANFDPKRRDAPVYVNDPGAWRAMVAEMAGKHFPLDYAENTRRLYVWECQHGESCEAAMGCVGLLFAGGLCGEQTEAGEPVCRFCRN